MSCSWPLLLWLLPHLSHCKVSSFPLAGSCTICFCLATGLIVMEYPDCGWKLLNLRAKINLSSQVVILKYFITVTESCVAHRMYPFHIWLILPSIMPEGCIMVLRVTLFHFITKCSSIA